MAWVVSFGLCGCGGRSLDADTAKWYNTPEEEGGWGNSSGGSTFAWGGTSHSIQSAQGGTTALASSTWIANGGTTMRSSSTRASGGAGGYHTVSGGGSGAVGGYSGAGGYSAKTKTSSAPKGGSSATGGASTKGGSSATGGTTSTAGRSSTGGKTSQTGTSGAAGSVSCPKVKCPTACPAGSWLGANGCYDCSCAPPPTQLSYDAVSCPTSALSLATSVARAARGDGTDWWAFDFTWTCTGFASSTGVPIIGKVRALVTTDSSLLVIDAANDTLYWSAAASPKQLDFGQLELSAEAGTVLTLVPTKDTFLSIRQEGSRFVGGLYLRAAPSTEAGVSSFTLAGAFDLVFPPILD